MCKINIISYDAGFVNHGFAVLQFDETYIKLLHSAYVRTDYEEFGANLVKFNNILTKYVNFYKPSLFVYEKPYMQKGNNVSFLNQMIGILTFNMYNNKIPLIPLSATEVKRTMCGKGKANKHEIESAVNKFLKIDKKYERDHESDAVAIGITYWLKNINS